jgi:opacity protein-like surface antigen
MPRRILLASVSAVTLAGSAFADDLSSHSTPVVPEPPTFSWTGVYAGGQIGYGWDASNTTISDGGFANGFTPPTPSTTTTTITTIGVGSDGTLAQSIGGNGGLQVSTGGGAGGGTVGVGSAGGITVGSGGGGIVAQSLGGGAGGGATGGSISAAAISPASAGPTSAAATKAADPSIPFLPYSYSDFNRFNNNANGVIGGAHVGYNYQINQFVLGLEGDVDGSSSARPSTSPPPAITIRTISPPACTRTSAFRVRSAAGSATPSTASSSTPQAASLSAVSTPAFRPPTPTPCSTRPSSAGTASRIPASARPSAAASNTPSQTIGRSGPNIAIPTSDRATMSWSIPSPASTATSSARECTPTSSRTACRSASTTNSTPPRPLRSSRSIEDPAST